MFKKLQNLLFEDEDEDIEKVEPQKTAPQSAPAPVQPAPQPVQPQPVVRPVVEPVQAQPAPAPAAPVAPVAPAAVEEPKAEEPKKTLGITVDDIISTEKKPVKPVAAKPVAPVSKEPASTYQFRPVISPVFGVNEKDVTALKNTTSKIKKVANAKKDYNVTPVLSPMYGVTAEESVVEEEDSVPEEMSLDNTPVAAKEDDVPEFSLDDILKVRDAEFAEEDRPVNEDEGPAFPDLTFGDEDAPEIIDDDDAPADMPADLPVNLPPDPVDDNIDNTVVIKQQLFDDDVK